MPPLIRTHEPPAAAPPTTLLDVVSHAPAAAALIVAALGKTDREALRLAHPQLRDVVGEATTCLIFRHILSRPPTARRWPRVEELSVSGVGSATLEALGVGEPWVCLRSLSLWYLTIKTPATVRAVAAAVRCMPALRALELGAGYISEGSSTALYSSLAEAAPQLRMLGIFYLDITPTTARALAVSGLRLEELAFGNMSYPDLTPLGHRAALTTTSLDALIAAPTFTIRRLKLTSCGLDASALSAVANAPWPLEELDLEDNDFSRATAASLSALSRHARLRKINLSHCLLNEGGFKALVDASWPAMTCFAINGRVTFDGPFGLGAASFSGFPLLEKLDLSRTQLGEAGARLLASRSWLRLRELCLFDCDVRDTGTAALARGAWPALKELNLRANRITSLTMADALRWAPALERLEVRSLTMTRN